MKQNSSTLDFNRIMKHFSFNDKLTRAALVFALIVSIVGIGYASYSANEVKTRAFDVYLGGEPIGKVRTEEEAKKVYDEIKDRLSSTYNMGVVLDKELGFQPTHAKDEELTDYNDLKENIQTRINVSVTGYSLDKIGRASCWERV